MATPRLLIGGRLLLLLALVGLATRVTSRGADLLRLDNGVVQVGLDRTKGASITWLSGAGDPANRVNLHDPGRLIQQSYYAGRSLDRRTEGQGRAWSPWPWNPIQGGGLSSWARVTDFRRLDDATLYAETVPKLWDMPSEEASALMRQWTGFEPGLPDVVVVRCELVCRRGEDDRWGPAVPRHQEVPACYFTRRFGTVRTYLGDGRWRDEAPPLGPPWSRTQPPRAAMAVFDAEGQGVAVYSPAATGQEWNFGPHGSGSSADPAAGPCLHIAPIVTLSLGPRSTCRYRYWLVLGDSARLAARLDELAARYSAERVELERP